MNNNLEKIELVVEKLDQIEGATGAVFASMAWSYAASLTGAFAQDIRLDDPQDPVYGRLTEEERLERHRQVESRITRMSEVLAWAASLAATDYAPTGEAVVERMLSDQQAPETDEALIATIAESMGVTLEEAREGARLNEQRLAEQRELQKKAIASDRTRIQLAIQSAIDAPVDPGWELEDQDAVRILERIAEKCEQYERNRLQRAFTTRRAKVIKQLAAERMLLADIMNEADELAERIQRQLDAQGVEMEHESDGRTTQQMVEDERRLKASGE